MITASASNNVAAASPSSHRTATARACRRRTAPRRPDRPPGELQGLQHAGRRVGDDEPDPAVRVQRHPADGDGRRRPQLAEPDLRSADPEPADGCRSNAGEKLVGNASVGLAGGAYSIPGTSPAVGGGLASVPLIGRVAPDHDYFGSARGTSVDIGAVQFVSAATPPPPPPAIPALTPALDNFNRANANNARRTNWSQPTLLGLAAIRINTNQANANSGWRRLLERPDRQDSAPSRPRRSRSAMAPSWAMRWC